MTITEEDIRTVFERFGGTSKIVLVDDNFFLLGGGGGGVTSGGWRVCRVNFFWFEMSSPLSRLNSL